MSKTKTKFEGIEAGRGIAALLVTIYHIAIHFELNHQVLPFGIWTKWGHAGVDFFFVLSGFLMMFIHFGDINQPQQFGRYFKRRCVRIYPFYWAMFFVACAMIAVSSSATYPSVPNMIAGFFLWPYTQGELVIGVAWTLHHEMIFYMLFGTLILSRRLGLIVLSIWFIMVVSKFFIWLPLLHNDWTSRFSSDFNVGFFMGMAVALLARSKRVVPALPILLAGVVALGLTVAGELSGTLNGYGQYARLAYGLASALIIWGTVLYERTRTLRIPWLLGMLGKSSYSLYLVHLIASGLMYKVFRAVGLLDAIPLWMSAVLLIITAVIAGILVHLWIEMPLTNQARKLADRCTGSTRQPQLGVE